MSALASLPQPAHGLRIERNLPALYRWGIHARQHSRTATPTHGNTHARQHPRTATPKPAPRLICLKSWTIQPACSSFWSICSRALASGVMSGVANLFETVELFTHCASIVTTCRHVPNSLPWFTRQAGHQFMHGKIGCILKAPITVCCDERPDVLSKQRLAQFLDQVLFILGPMAPASAWTRSMSSE